jgi:hypothetical protein
MFRLLQALSFNSTIEVPFVDGTQEREKERGN